MKKKIIEPFRKYIGGNEILDSRNFLLSYFECGKLFIVLQKTIAGRLKMQYLVSLSEVNNVYTISNRKFIVDLFDSDIYDIVKDVKIFGLNFSEKGRIEKVERVIGLRPFHINSQLIELVDLYFYSENNFETIVLYG